jgi:hypothetical protein
MVPHFLIHCSDCGFPFLLPADTIEDTFGDPESLANNALAVGVVCSECKWVDRYFLDRKHAQYDPRNQAWILDTRSEDTILLEILQCEEDTCESRLPLFAYWNPSTPPEERAADSLTWRWENLKCPEGHVIPRPGGL